MNEEVIVIRLSGINDADTRKHVINSIKGTAKAYAKRNLLDMKFFHETRRIRRI